MKLLSRLCIMALALPAAVAMGDVARSLQDSIPQQMATCVLDPTMVNAKTLPLLENIGISIFASACGKNRGAFVLATADGHTYGCLDLPEPQMLEMLELDDANVTNVTSLANVSLANVEDIKEAYEGGNITAGDTVELLSFLIARTYASTPGVNVEPYACDTSGLVTLENCPAKRSRRRRRMEEIDAEDGDDDDSTGDDVLHDPEPKSEDELDSDGKSVPIRAVTIAGVFSPNDVWSVYNSSTAEGVTLTQRDAEFYYTTKDFSNMSAMGLNAVQFPVAVDLFAEPRPAGFLNLLNKWILYTAKYKMQAIIKLEYSRHSQYDVTMMAAVKEAMVFFNGINVNHNSTVVKAVTLPSTDPAVMGAAASAGTAIPLWLPAKVQDLTHVQELASAVEGVTIEAVSLDLSHTSTIADIASSTDVEDRNKLFFHETFACINRAPLEYTDCYQGLPVFVSSGFHLAIDDCHMKPVADYHFQDYGQCGRLSETTHSNWWHQHRLSFASRQIAAYEKGGMGWSFATWKLFRVGKGKIGYMDKPAKLLALQDVHANGWFPSLVEDQYDLSLSCLNPPVQDAVLGDSTLAPTMGPPPDCGDGWWNYTTEQCDFWVPPPFDATECPNTTIIYEECPDAASIDAEEAEEEKDAVSHTLHLWQGFLLGIAVASVGFAVLYRCCFGHKYSGYQAIPEPMNGFQEYQHHSQNSLKGGVASQPTGMGRGGRV